MGRKAAKVELVKLPKDDSATLQDQDDAILWQKLQILLQAVDELTAEHGDAGDATRQLRVITQECVRRDMFGFSIREREPGPEQLWTWYELLKQLLEGEVLGAWDKTEGTDKQYAEVISALKKSGETMPQQNVALKELEFTGEIIT